MEVCFIKGDYRDFLREQCPELDSEIGPGWFVNSEGVKLGKHKGAPYYTIGQRKGLEIALGKPAYVLKINPQKNTVMLGNADQLETEYMLAEQDKMVDERELFGCENLTVRIRYRSRPIPCRVKRLEDGRLLIHFLEIASAIAPGQSAVFYDGKRVLGGAFIASALYFSISLPASCQELNPLSSSKTLYPFSLKIAAAFLLRFPLRQYTATGLSFCNKESAIEAKESSITLILIVLAICPSEYSASVRTSRRCTSSS